MTLTKEILLSPSIRYPSSSARVSLVRMHHTGSPEVTSFPLSLAGHHN